MKYLQENIKWNKNLVWPSSASLLCTFTNGFDLKKKKSKDSTSKSIRSLFELDFALFNDCFQNQNPSHKYKAYL